MKVNLILKCYSKLNRIHLPATAQAFTHPSPPRGRVALKIAEGTSRN